MFDFKKGDRLHQIKSLGHTFKVLWEGEVLEEDNGRATLMISYVLYDAYHQEIGRGEPCTVIIRSFKRLGEKGDLWMDAVKRAFPDILQTALSIPLRQHTQTTINNTEV